MLCASIDYRAGERALVVQHRDELVSQNRRTFHRVHPGAVTGVVDADQKQFGHGVIFAMVQTLAGASNIDRLRAVDTLLVDEAHHIAAGSWLKIVDKCRELNPDLRLAGFTATPERGDRKSLRVCFDNVADQITLAELIAAGNLVPPRTFVVDLGVREALQGVRKTAADFDMEAVERIMDKVPLNEEIVRHWKEKAGNRQTVVFASTVDHAKHVCEAFAYAGVSAEAVTQETTDREAILRAFDRREIQVIVNVAVLTEGWDNQPVSCVVLLRPSSHKSTMIQMIGRGLRPVDPEIYPGTVKSDCIVLDFGTSTLQHGSLEMDVNLEAPERTKGAAPEKECPSCGGWVPMGCKECPLCGAEFPAPPEAGATEKGTISGFGMVEIDLLNASPYRWEDIWSDGSILVASAFESWSVVVWYHGQWHAIGGSTETGFKHIAVGERTMSIALADDFLREHGDSSSAAKSKSWLNASATEKQLGLLGLTPLTALGLNRYAAACRLTWKFNERGIRKKLETVGGAA